MFYLYMLADQSSDNLQGEKFLMGEYDSEQKCHDAALSVLHYSIEFESNFNTSIIFVK